MKKFTVTNVKSCTETGENEDHHLCCFELVGDDNMQVSDGFHTIDELYEHRIRLWITLCRYFIQGKASYDSRNVWISKLHSNGSSFDGRFIMGIGREKGNQITYHLPISYWKECEKTAQVLEKAPEYDGHTSDDVLGRLKNL